MPANDYTAASRLAKAQMEGHVTPILKTFTVFGVWNNDGPGQDTAELIVAAVVEGIHPPVDDGEGSDWTRYATVVQARDAAEAEDLAGREV